MPDKINFSDFQKLDPPRLAESRREAGIRNKNITFATFQLLDIRIGTVIEASVPEWSHWVMKLIVDLGPEIGQKTVFAGIMKFYKPEELIGKQFPFVVNLEPKKMGPMGDFSEGMILAASDIENNEQKAMNNESEEEKPILLSPWEKLKTGAKIR